MACRVHSALLLYTMLRATERCTCGVQLRTPDRIALLSRVSRYRASGSALVVEALAAMRSSVQSTLQAHPLSTSSLSQPSSVQVYGEGVLLSADRSVETLGALVGGLPFADELQQRHRLLSQPYSLLCGG